MTKKKLKGSSKNEGSDKTTAEVKEPLKIKKVDMVKAQELALFMEKARKILEKNLEIDTSVSVIDMEKKRREQYLNDLVDYQARKEHLYILMIGYFLIAILLGLVAMTLVKVITDVGIYIIWGVLVLSNVLLVIGLKLYDRAKVDSIIGRFTEGDEKQVIENPINSEKV